MLRAQNRCAEAVPDQAGPSGWVSNLWSPSGKTTQGWALRVQKCAVGRSQEVSSRVALLTPAALLKAGLPGTIKVLDLKGRAALETFPCLHRHSKRLWLTLVYLALFVPVWLRSRPLTRPLGSRAGFVLSALPGCSQGSARGAGPEWSSSPEHNGRLAPEHGKGDAEVAGERVAGEGSRGSGPLGRLAKAPDAQTPLSRR